MLYYSKKMTFFQSIFLAFIQGLTEFLPLSSSGHLVLFQKLFGLEPPILFDILVHVGTLGAVFLFFRQELKLLVVDFFKKEKKAVKLVSLMVVGTLPAALVGFWLKSFLEVVFSSLRLLSFAYLLTSLLLFSTKLVKEKKKGLEDLSWRDALFIGFFQALALLPGVSRSGATITAALWLKTKPQAAFRFSFYLAIPAVLGALVLELPALFSSSATFWLQGALGMFVAGGVGFISLKLLDLAIKRWRFWLFGFYCLFLSIIIFFLS